MQLIINYPTDPEGIKEFNIAFAQVQKELILHCIKSLDVNLESKQKILNGIKVELKKQIDEQNKIDENK